MFFKLLYYRLLLEEELRQERGFNGVIHYDKKRKINGLIHSNKKREQEAKEKVLKAIEELKQNGETISIRKVAKMAKVSVNTARKYLKIHNYPYFKNN